MTPPTGRPTMPLASPQRIVSTTLLLVGVLASNALAALPKVPEGFEIRLVAAVPAVQFPCQVATAPDGSLFVAEDPMDQVGPPDKPVDRILVFRDGKEPVVFADKLNAVFGMVWRDGSLYVMNMPNLTVLKDVDGDGKADSRVELFKDLGVPAGQPNMFNDHIVSGLQFGIDGMLYISVGDKGVPKATGPDGRTAQVVGGGILRCRPDGTGLEVFSEGTRNHLEPNLDDRDNLFTYDNTDDGLGWWTRVTHHVDGAWFGYPWDYHDRKDRMLDRMAEYGGGSPCGGLVYKEDAWPAKYRGRALWAEWAKRVVRGIAIKPDGASFKVADESDFITPDKVSDFRPLDLALSYDGKTLYIADWGYGGWNNKTEKLGRVYAVTYNGKLDAPPRPRGLDSDPLPAQLLALDHPAFNERTRAQLAIARLGGPALAPVVSALADPKTDPVARRHLVWTLDALAGGTLDATTPLLDTLAHDPAPDVRAQAVRALGLRAIPTAVAPLVTALADPDPAVRLQALIALGRIGDKQAVPALIPLVASPDPYLAFSARKALRRLGDFKVVGSALASTQDPKIRQGLALTLETIFHPDAADALAAFTARPDVPPAERAHALTLLSHGERKTAPWDGKWWGTQPAKSKPPAHSIDWAGTPLILSTLRERLADPEPLLRLAAADAEAHVADPVARPLLRERFAVDPDVPVRKALAHTLGLLGDVDALPPLIAALRDPRSPDDLRDESLAAVETIGTDVALKALLSLLDADTLGPDRQPRIVAALGRFKTEEATRALLTATRSPSPSVRAAAATALARSAKPESVGQALLSLLPDPVLAVRKAAINAVGALKDRQAVARLVEAADPADTRHEAMLALAAVPDLRALPIYLRGLTDKSPDLRKASSEAIASIQDEAAPTLAALADRKELPSTTLPELRKIYTRVRPVTTWQILGPFPIKTDPPFSLESPVDLKSKISGFSDAPLAWKRARGVDAKTGQVDLLRMLKGDDDLAAFASAEVESPLDRKAEFAVGSDDTLTVWLNGEKVYDFQDRRGYDPASSRFDAPLNKGKNRLLVRCGNRGGPWAFSVAVASPSDLAFLKGPAPGAFDAETFRKHAQSTKGNPDHGRALFSDLKGLACLKCHAVGGQGGAVGPELTSVGAKYPKDELITAVLYPSAKISSGYEPVVLALTDGKILTGILKSETPETLEIEDADAHRLKIPKSDLDDRKLSPVSLMPNGLAEGLTPDDFADLVAYLETLKDQPKPRP